MYLCLCEVDRVCRQGAKVALVVGNAQYNGKALLVDEFTQTLGSGLASSARRFERCDGEETAHNRWEGTGVRRPERAS